MCTAYLRSGTSFASDAAKVKYVPVVALGELVHVAADESLVWMSKEHLLVAAASRRGCACV
jgi:hypothetical protein